MKARKIAALAAAVSCCVASSAFGAFLSFGPPNALNSTATSDADASQPNDDVDQDVSIAAGGSGVWIAAWSSDNPLGGTTGPDSDILFARSTDNGATWSAAGPLMPATAAADTAPDTSPRVAGSGSTFITVFSSSNNLGDTPESDQDILFSRSADGGQTWSAPDRINSGGLVDDGFEIDAQSSIATDGAGNWVVVWKHSKLSAPTGDRVFYSYSTDDGVTWAPQQALGALQTISIGNGQGTTVAWSGVSFVVAWGSAQDLGSNGNDGDILVSVLVGPTYLATPAALLSSNGSTDSSSSRDSYPSMTVVGTTLIVAWQSTDTVGASGTDSDILFSRSTTNGLSWSSAGLLASNAAVDTGEDVRVALATDGEVTLAVWDSTDPLDGLSKSDRDIFVARSTDDGQTWSETDVLATNAGKDKGTDSDVSIAADAATGSWNVAWTTNDTLANTLGGDEDILWVHSSEDCPALPVSAGSCIQSTAVGASSLLIKEGGAKDSFLWKFARGDTIDKAMDLGDPVSTDDYVLCIYDRIAGTPGLIVELDAKSGGICAGKACWTDVGTGYNYKHKSGTISAVSLTAGSTGTSKASVKAKSGFDAPALPLAVDTSISARLHNLTNGKCLATDFSTTSVNTAEQLKAKSD
jgi:hypothetical protein